MRVCGWLCCRCSEPLRVLKMHCVKCWPRWTRRAQKFQSAQADFEWTEFEAAVQETDTQKGTIFFKRERAEMQMAAHLTSPQEKFVVYKAGTLQLFEPKIDHLTEFSAGANRQRYESFSTLGFGGRGSSLETEWVVTSSGSRDRWTEWRQRS